MGVERRIAAPEGLAEQQRAKYHRRDKRPARQVRCAAERSLVHRGKIGVLAALLAGLATVMLINEIGISRYPPSGLFPDGAVRGFYPSHVRSPMGARALAALGDGSPNPVAISFNEGNCDGGHRPRRLLELFKGAGGWT
jgi:hypothetical protein